MGSIREWVRFGNGFNPGMGSNPTCFNTINKVTFHAESWDGIGDGFDPGMGSNPTCFNTINKVIFHVDS